MRGTTYATLCDFFGDCTYVSIDGTIVSDGRLAVLAVNRGVPFVVSHPDGALSRDITKLARTLAGDAIAAKDKPNKRGLFARR